MKHQKLLERLLVITFSAAQIIYFSQGFLIFMKKATEIHPLALLSSCALIMITFVILIIYSIYLYRYGRLKSEVAYLEKQEQIQKKEQEKQLASQKYLQGKKDCFLSEMKELKHLLESGDMEQGYVYSTQLFESFEHSRYRHYCSSPIVDAILHGKEEDALENGISITYDISLPSKIQLSSSVLICILFNLLDNGIEACNSSHAEAPFISLQISYKGDYLSLYMNNSKNTAHTFNHQTTKLDDKMHGLGLTIIEDLAAEHEGTCEWNDLGNEFESLVMMKY